MSAGQTPRFVHPALMLQTAISAGTYLSAKHALSYMGWPALVMLRNLGSSTLLVAIVLASGGLLMPPREAWGRVALLGLLGIPLNQGLFIAGLARSTPAHAALLYTLTPLFVLLLGLVTGTEKLEPRKGLGLLLALAGAATVVFGRHGGAVDVGPRIGDLMILAAVVAWALYTVRNKGLVAQHGTMRATAWPLVTGTLLFLPIGAEEATGLDHAHLPATVWGALVFLVVMTSVVSYLCWSYALKYLDASRVAIYTNLQPVATAALSWAILGEAVTSRLVGGGALVVAGVWVATRPARSETH